MNKFSMLKFNNCIISFILIVFCAIPDFSFAKEYNLTDIVNEGRIDDIKQALSEGLDINARTEWDGWTMLMRAASSHQNEKTFKFLLDRGADISIKAKDGRTVLSTAVQGYSLNNLKLLIDKGLNLKCPEGNEAFMDAAAGGCTDIVELFIKNGISVNYTNKIGLTALMLISGYGDRIEFMKFLIRNGADINLGHPRGGLTPLMMAAEDNHTAEIKLLVENGADVNAKTTKGISALDIAVEMKKTDAVEILKKYGAISTYRANPGKLARENSIVETFEMDSQASELMIAAYNGKSKTVEALLEKRNYPVADSRGRTALYYAIAGGNFETVKLLARELTNSGCERDVNYTTPIFYAVIYNNVKAAKWLIKLVRPNHVRGDGMSPMRLAVELGRMDIIELFEKYKITQSRNFRELYFGSRREIPEINSYDYVELVDSVKKDDFENIKKYFYGSEKSDTLAVYARAMIFASAEGDIESLEYFMKKGVDINHYTDRDRKTSPLIVACANKRIGMAKYLIEHGADMYYEDSFRKDALHRAMRSHTFELIDYFVGKGYNIDKIYSNGKTLLMIACNGYKKDNWKYSEHMEFIKKLLANHADPNFKNGGPSDGETVLIMAMENENNELAKLLIEHGADVNADDAAGVTPLMIASRKGNLEGVKILIDHKADVNACDRDGENALFGAIANGYNDVVKLLIANKANIDVINHNGQTPIKIALKFKNHEAAELLKLKSIKK